ncbi:MAG: hypothetical protein ACI4U5_00100 [Bacilli bacterium]
MERKGLVSLYVASKNDTVESICEKLRIERDILYRYNPLLKTVHVHENMPLTIVSFFKEEELPIREDKKNNDDDLNNDNSNQDVKKPPVSNKQELNRLLREIAFYLKEGLASNTFYKENIMPVSEELEILYKDLTTIFKKLNNEEYKQKFINFLKEFEKQYFEIVSLIQKKDPELIKRYQKNLEMITDDLVAFLEEVEEEINKPSIVEAIKRLSELFQLFALKISTLRFKTAQTVFREILHQMDLLSEAIVLDEEKEGEKKKDKAD